MNRYFKYSTPTMKKSHPETFDYSVIKFPDSSIGSLKKSVHQLKNDLIIKLEYERALKRLDISPNPSKYRNPFRGTPEPLLKSSKKKIRIPQEHSLDEFIDAMFFNVNNSYKLFNRDLGAPIDYFTAEMQVKNLKRLKPIVQTIEDEDADKTPLEQFWKKNISQYSCVRWDTFEENLCRHFVLNINTSIGKIRKIDWELLLQKLFKKISSTTNELELWPGHPGLPSISYTGQAVSLSSFQNCVLSGQFKSLVAKSLKPETFYLKERYKNEKFKFASGCTYKGVWKGLHRDGLGQVSIENEYFFDGYLFKGLRHGYGSCESGGCMYKGYWEDDLLDGPGELQYFDGSSIYGVWKKGKVISGRLKWAGGEYTGYFNTTCFEGIGTFVSSNYDIKKGLWSCGKLNGEGEISLSNGTSYKGKFIDDLLEGKGQIETCGFSYTGEVKSSQPDGEGHMIYKSDLSEYTGFFKAGIENGKGCYRTSKEVFTGEFVLGKLTGKGERSIGKSSKYVGDFTDSMMHGKGTLRINTDMIKVFYSGELRINRLHGYGKLKINNNEYNGEFAYGDVHGAGELMMEGTSYRGVFNRGKVEGKGAAYFVNGSYYEGEWVDGVPNGSGEALDHAGYWIAASFTDGKPNTRNKLQSQFFSQLVEFKIKITEFSKSLAWIVDNLSAVVYPNC